MIISPWIKSVPIDAPRLDGETLVNCVITHAHEQLRCTAIKTFEVRARVDGGQFKVWWAADSYGDMDALEKVRHPHYEAKKVKRTETEPEHLLIARIAVR